MAIKTILLSHLEMELAKTLNECAESGETIVVELPDHRLLAIQGLDPNEDDTLMDELLAANSSFQAVVAKSKASTRKSFAEITSQRRMPLPTPPAGRPPSSGVAR